MEYIWIAYEHVPNARLQEALGKVDTFIEAGEPGRVLVTTSQSPKQLQELVWELNNGAFCEVTVADYDDIEDLL